MTESRPLRLFLTEDHPCSYLPERLARSQVIGPPEAVDTAAYNALIRAGFRRSGHLVYRPACHDCAACVPVRLPVADFSPDRAQRRAWKTHGPLQARLLAPAFDEAHFALYRDYQSARHPGGGMDDDDRQHYSQFLLQSPVDSLLLDFHAGSELLMVCLIDRVADGLSSVYTFYDPAARGSLGTYGILWQIALCRQLGLPYLYLGYWIAASRKMAYKARFRPLQGLKGHDWTPLD